MFLILEQSVLLINLFVLKLHEFLQIFYTYVLNQQTHTDKICFIIH
jgi:hypothetical protein